jgi:predicted RNase H-like nuclease
LGQINNNSSYKTCRHRAAREKKLAIRNSFASRKDLLNAPFDFNSGQNKCIKLGRKNERRTAEWRLCSTTLVCGYVGLYQQAIAAAQGNEKNDYCKKQMSMIADSFDFLNTN